MSIKYVTSRGPTDVKRVNLEVSVNGLSLVIHGGSFILRKSEYYLGDDEEVGFSSPDQDTWVNLWLVVDHEDGDVVRVLRDDFVEGVVDRYNFKSQYRFDALYLLAYLLVPSGMASLEVASIHINRSIGLEDE